MTVNIEMLADIIYVGHPSNFFNHSSKDAVTKITVDIGISRILFELFVINYCLNQNLVAESKSIEHWV